MDSHLYLNLLTFFSLLSEAFALHYTLSNLPTSNPMNIKPNGSIHLLVEEINSVPSSASKAVTGGIFLGAQEVVPILATS